MSIENIWKDQDRFAAWSQEKAARAQESGRLAKEIVPVETYKEKKSDNFY